MQIKLVAVLFAVGILVVMGCVGHGPTPTPTPTLTPTPTPEPTPEAPSSKYDIGDYLCTLDGEVCGTVVSKEWSESRQKWAYTIKTATGRHSTWGSYFRRG